MPVRELKMMSIPRCFYNLSYMSNSGAFVKIASDGNLYISIQQLVYKCRTGRGIMAEVSGNRGLRAKIAVGAKGLI